MDENRQIFGRKIQDTMHRIIKREFKFYTEKSRLVSTKNSSQSVI